MCVGAWSRHKSPPGIALENTLSTYVATGAQGVKRTKHLTGWILRTFSSRDKLTLFKALVMSRLDYGCQLWSPYLIKHINMVEKVQRSFTRFISGMAGLSYTERLTVLKLYSLQCRREIYYYLCVEDFGGSGP